MISKTYIYLNLSLGLSSALDCFTRILTCDSHNHLEGQVPYCPTSREGCCSQKLDTCPRSLQAEKQTSVSIPNSRTGALNPPTLPLDTVTTSRLIRPAWTAKLSYVWQSQSHFFVKQRPPPHKGYKPVTEGFSWAVRFKLPCSVTSQQDGRTRREHRCLPRRQKGSQDVHSGRKPRKKPQERHQVNRNKN